jgi:hypothetical protein
VAHDRRAGVNQREARRLQDVLSERFPQGKVTVTAEEDGAQVVIEMPDQDHRWSLGDGPSVLLNYLLTGRAI